MKRIFNWLLATTLFATPAMADFNITSIDLGISINELQSRLRSEKVVFLEFSDSKIVGRKYALGAKGDPTLPNEYPNLEASTEITAEICDKKVYKLSFKSQYKRDLNGLLLGRKAIYEYLAFNKATLNLIDFNQKEGSSDVFESFVIDRDVMGGSARGKEEIKFGIYVAGKWNGGEPIIGFRYDVVNKWFCPN